MRTTHKRSGFRRLAVAWIAAYALVLNAVLFSLAAGAAVAPDPLGRAMVLCASADGSAPTGDHAPGGHVHCALCGLGGSANGPAALELAVPARAEMDPPVVAAGEEPLTRAVRATAQPRAPPLAA